MPAKPCPRPGSVACGGRRFPVQRGGSRGLELTPAGRPSSRHGEACQPGEASSWHGKLCFCQGCSASSRLHFLSQSLATSSHQFNLLLIGLWSGVWVVIGPLNHLPKVLAGVGAWGCSVTSDHYACLPARFSSSHLQLFLQRPRNGAGPAGERQVLARGLQGSGPERGKPPPLRVA